MEQKVWTYNLQKFKVSWVLPQYVNQLIEGDLMLGRDKDQIIVVLSDICSPLDIVEQKESTHF